MTEVFTDGGKIAVGYDNVVSSDRGHAGVDGSLKNLVLVREAVEGDGLWCLADNWLKNG